ncbi:unnamed protein product [Parajaminaea phylloscopi]
MTQAARADWVPTPLHTLTPTRRQHIVPSIVSGPTHRPYLVESLCWSIDSEHSHVEAHRHCPTRHTAA